MGACELTKCALVLVFFSGTLVENITCFIVRPGFFVEWMKASVEVTRTVVLTVVGMVVVLTVFRVVVGLTVLGVVVVLTVVRAVVVVTFTEVTGGSCVLEYIIVFHVVSGVDGGDVDGGSGVVGGSVSGGGAGGAARSHGGCLWSSGSSLSSSTSTTMSLILRPFIILA